MLAASGKSIDFNSWFLSFFYCMGVSHTCVSVYHVRALYPQRSQEFIRSFETGVTGGCKQSFERWRLNPSPLQGQVLNP